MLQMLTKEKIDQFYKDVEGLNLRFPVAELHRMTGFSKGQISQVLGKTLSPSDDLIKEFYKSLNKVHSADSIAIYERIIEEKEARRRDAEAWAQKMEAHYNDMRNALERAQTTINEVLKPIKEQTAEILSNSKKVNEGVRYLKTEIVAEHGEMMETLDQIAGNEPGTTAARAGTVELGHRLQKSQKGKKTNMGKNG